MKNKYGLLILLLLPFLFLAGCKPNETDKEIALIDSLYSAVENTRDTLATIDHEKVKQKYELYKKSAKELQDHFYEIKTDENWPYICEYRNVRRPLRDMSQNYPMLKSEIDSSLRQLENLKHDLMEGSMGKEEFETYFRLESETASGLILRISRQVELTQRHLANFDTIHPYIEEQLRLYREKQSKVAEKTRK